MVVVCLLRMGKTVVEQLILPQRIKEYYQLIIIINQKFSLLLVAVGAQMIMELVVLVEEHLVELVRR